MAKTTLIGRLIDAVDNLPDIFRNALQGLGCLSLIVVSVLLGRSCMVDLERQHKAREKATDEARSQVLESLDIEVQRILPVLDLHKETASPRILGEYIVWYVGPGIEYITYGNKTYIRSTGGMIEHRMPGTETRYSRGAALTSYPAFYNDRADANAIIASYTASKMPSLVIVKGSVHETGTYRETMRIQGNKLLPPRSSETEEARAYKFEVWLVDRQSMKITGHRDFVPDPLPQKVSGSAQYRTLNQQLDRLFAWLESLYDQRSK